MDGKCLELAEGELEEKKMGRDELKEQWLLSWVKKGFQKKGEKMHFWDHLPVKKKKKRMISNTKLKVKTYSQQWKAGPQ